MNNRVTYFDLEWANSVNRSICQIGIISEDVDSGGICVEKSIMVNPEDGFDPICSGVHGITENMVSSEKTLPEVWNEIKPCLTGAIIIGHNVASADLRTLDRNLSRYGLDVPELYYIDTLEIAKELVPDYYVENYKLDTLCRFFGIKQNRFHNALCDAASTKSLFEIFENSESCVIQKYVRRYDRVEYEHFVRYVSDVAVRKAITDFSGVIRGLVADNVINREELDYLEQWKKNNSCLMFDSSLRKLVDYTDVALSDGVLTENELCDIHSIIREYYGIVKGSTETKALQLLEGILKGIAVDGKINALECSSLQSWLYENCYLKGQYPYDRILSCVENVLFDGVVTEEESDDLLKEIDGILNPLAVLHSQVDMLNGKKICLSGDFVHGTKREVTEYIVSKGGIVEDNVKKATDILVVGGRGSAAYSNGNYGTKVKKAIEFNNRGSSITIMKEEDLYSIDC